VEFECYLQVLIVYRSRIRAHNIQLQEQINSSFVPGQPPSHLEFMLVVSVVIAAILNPCMCSTEWGVNYINIIQTQLLGTSLVWPILSGVPQPPLMVKHLDMSLASPTTLQMLTSERYIIPLSWLIVMDM
jgi:hypothetical protein